MSDAIQFANDRPTSLSDDLYQWATDAEEIIRKQAAELAALRGSGEPFMVLEETGWEFPEGTDSDWLVSLPMGTKTYLHPQPSAVPVVTQLVEALDRLAKLGNGERYGNSIGNEIAFEALTTGQQWLKENTHD